MLSLKQYDNLNKIESVKMVNLELWPHNKNYVLVVDNKGNFGVIKKKYWIRAIDLFKRFEYTLEN